MKRHKALHLSGYWIYVMVFGKKVAFRRTESQVWYYQFTKGMGNGDPMECGSYRGIKLFEHATKVVGRTFNTEFGRRLI